MALTFDFYGLTIAVNSASADLVDTTYAIGIDSYAQIKIRQQVERTYLVQ
jgi:hypothetical protein